MAGVGEQRLETSMSMSLEQKLKRDGELPYNYLKPFWKEASEQDKKVVVEAIGGSHSLVIVHLSSLSLTVEEVGMLCQGLQSNNVIELLFARKSVAFGTWRGCGHIAEMLKVNRSLKELDLTGTGMEAKGFALIAESLHQNTTLGSLNVSDNSLGDAGAKSIAEALISYNSTLTVLNLSKNEIQQDGVAAIACALYEKCSLEELHLSYNGLGSSGVKTLLDRLIRSEEGCNLKRLHIATWGTVKGCVQSLVDLLRKDCLTLLNLGGFDLSTKDWIALLAALRDNTSLQTLQLAGCSSVDGVVVFQELMTLLDENTSLKRIVLTNTGLHAAGKAEAVKEKLRRNAEEYVAVLKEMDHEKPNSARVFLCGYPYAGKTALRRSMVRGVKASALLASLHSRFLSNTVMRFHQSLSRMCNRSEWERTRGIEIQLLKHDADLRLSVWDLAGQEEFHSFQDSLFPDADSACIFLFVYSAVIQKTGQEKKVEELRTELRYWLRFIASTSRRPAPDKPQIIVVITNKDRVQDPDRLLLRCERIVSMLSLQFEDLVTVRGNTYSVNATCFQDVEPLVKDVVQSCKDLLRTKDIPKACGQVRVLLEKWISEHPGQPIIKPDDFFSLCRQAKSLRNMRDPEKLIQSKAVASYLHNAGEIIYFQELDFVVLNAHWFCHGILGHLIRIPGFHAALPTDRGGFTAKNHLVQLLHNSVCSLSAGNSRKTVWCCPSNQPVLSDINAEDLITLMMKMQLCYEDEGKYFIPATLDDDNGAADRGDRRLEWPPLSSHSTCIFLGRRLECDDQIDGRRLEQEQLRTFLTSGFFCRLQVMFRKEFMAKGCKGTYHLKRNLIAISQEKLDILVEYSGSVGYYIDVLVRSSMTEQETLQVVQKEVVERIRTFCASHLGCQGVSLVEAVVRRECVERLTTCRHRRRQAQPVEVLKAELKASNNPDFVHSWPVSADAGLDATVERTVSLLGPDEAMDALIERPLQDLQEVALPEQEPELRRIRRLVERMDTRLVERMDRLDEVVKMLEEIKSQQIHTWNKTMDAINDVLGFSLGLQQHIYPQMPVLMDLPSNLPRRLFNLLPGKEKQVSLHFMCECRVCPHLVRGQPGMTILFHDELRQRMLRYVIGTLRLLHTVVKVAAHVGAGIGNAINNFAQLQEAMGITAGGLVTEEILSKVNISGGDAVDDNNDWQVDVLLDVDITKTFMLHRVLYRRSRCATNEGRKFAWLCPQHLREGVKDKTLDVVGPLFGEALFIH